MDTLTQPAVFAQTNDARANELVVFTRDEQGRLANGGRYATGGRGTGAPHLPSQGSVVVAEDRVFVANAGSHTISLFSLEGEPKLVRRVASGGERPTSIAVHGDHVYVVNAGSATVIGFDLDLNPVHGALFALATGTDPAQIAFTPDGRGLVITDRASDSIILLMLSSGVPRSASAYAAGGMTPYGFDFAGNTLVVTEAFGGAVGEAAASSYAFDGNRLETVSRSVGNSRSEVCWAVTAPDGRHVWVTNFGDGTISLYAVAADGSLELVDPVAAATVEGMKGIRDAARSGDGQFFYALDADARRVFSYRIGVQARLEAIGSVDGLPETVAGLAAL